MTEVATNLPIELGQTLAERYRVERVLATSGMSVIVQGTDIETGGPVAIKMLPVDATRIANSVDRFERERRVLEHLRGDHAVEVVAHGRLSTGTPYMVMEFLDGATLGELLRTRGPFRVSDAVDYVLQACEVLARAHTAGVIHRDVKPSNLFLTQRADGTPWIKVLDFGLSKARQAGPALGEDERSLTFAGEVMGSPVYMAPEQLLSSSGVDQGADIWSIGVVLYELLTGALPFEGETVERIRANVMMEAPRPISSLRPDVPADLEAIVMRCLRKLSNDRYRGLTVLAASLAPFGGASARNSAARILASAPSRRPPPLPMALAAAGSEEASGGGRVLEVFSFDAPAKGAQGREAVRATSWSMVMAKRARSARRSTLLAVSLVFFTIGLSIGAVYSVWDHSSKLARGDITLGSKSGG